MRCFEHVFPHLSQAEIVRAAMARLGRWDSMRLVTLLGVVEREFRLTLTPAEINRCTSFQAMLEVVRSAQGRARRAKRSDPR